MTDVGKKALRALRGPRHKIENAQDHVSRTPGLYAIYGEADVWRELGLGDPPDERPLYVGKSESSLLGRDLGQHFGDGRTGSSTVRRSFAALLRQSLKLKGMPRNPARPERFANYALSPEHDRRLTAWMREHLELAVWPSPPGLVLGNVEFEVLAALQPPLNLAGLSTTWTATVSAARAVMAAEARMWAEKQRGTAADKGASRSAG